MGKTFVAILGAGKGTWGHIGRLVADNEWSKIILIGNEWSKENYKLEKEAEWVLINNRSGFDVIKNAIKEAIANEKDLAVSLISGSGKEHIAILAALREADKKFDLVILTQEGVKSY